MQISSFQNHLVHSCCYIFNAVKTHAVIPQIMGGVECKMSEQCIFIPGCWPCKTSVVLRIGDSFKTAFFFLNLKKIFFRSQQLYNIKKLFLFGMSQFFIYIFDCWLGNEIKDSGPLAWHKARWPNRVTQGQSTGLCHAQDPHSYSHQTKGELIGPDILKTCFFCCLILNTEPEIPPIMRNSRGFIQKIHHAFIVKHLTYLSFLVKPVDVDV